MTYRSPFRDVADAFSNVAPNVAQGVANQAERKRQEDAWARAAAQKQSEALQARLGELTAQKNVDPSNKAETDQQIAMVARAMDMYRDVYTAQPGKAYDSWMAVSSGSLSVPTVGAQAAASPRERAAGRDVTGQQMSVPELMGRSAGTVASNLLNSDQRRLVQTSNSELVRKSYEFLMNPDALDLSNPLVQEQAAMILNSVNSLMGMEVLPGMETMRDQLPDLVRGLRTIIMQSDTSTTLRDLSMRTASNAAEQSDLSVQQARANLDITQIERSFLPAMRQAELDARTLTWQTGNEQLKGLTFANAATQYEAFMATGFTASPEQEAALITRLGVGREEFESMKQVNFERYRQSLEREETRLNLEVENLRLVGVQDARAADREQRAAAFDELKMQELQQSLARGTFLLEQDQWTFGRNRQLSEVTDATDALSYVMQATQQGDAAALSFILRETVNGESIVGQMFGSVFTVEQLEERYQSALNDEDLRNRDKERRSALSDIEYRAALTRANGDELAAGLEFGRWAAQSMTESELTQWHAQQVRDGKSVPPIEDVQLMRVLHRNNLTSPVKQEIWSRIESLSSMPATAETIGPAFEAIGRLLESPELGLSRAQIDAHLNGFAVAQGRALTAFDLEMIGLDLKNDLTRAQTENFRADAAARFAQAQASAQASGGNEIAAFTGMLDDVAAGTLNTFKLAEASYNATRLRIGDLEGAMLDRGCTAPTRTVTGFEASATTINPRVVLDANGNPLPDCQEMNDQFLQLTLANDLQRVEMEESQAFLRWVEQSRRQALGFPATTPGEAPPAPPAATGAASGTAGSATAAAPAVPVVPAAPAAAGTTPAAAAAAPAAAQAAPAAAAAAAPAAAAPATATPAAAPAAAPVPRQQGPMRNPNPNNVPPPTLLPGTNPPTASSRAAGVPAQPLPTQSRVAQQSSDLAATLTGATQGADVETATGTLTSFVFGGWHPSYRNANAARYVTPQEMARAAANMAPGRERDALVNDLRSYLNSYVTPGIRGPYQESAGSTRVAGQILAALGLRQ